MTGLSTKKDDHWNSYYSSDTTPKLPSQFAVFALNEMMDVDCVLEFGCGNGRDTLFFARQNLKVLGCDRSKAGIELCSQSADAQNLNAIFQECDLNDKATMDNIIATAKSKLDGKLMIYARFFVHAIDETAETTLLDVVSKIMKENGDSTFMVEFRTQRDKEQTKVTPDHYRRFVNPLQFAEKAKSFNLSNIYFVEGFGMAKYKSDDAHVARMIFSYTDA